MDARRERGVCHCMRFCVSLMLCIIIYYTHDSIGLYAIACICYRPSACPSVTRVNQTKSKTVEGWIMQFSPHSIAPSLVREYVFYVFIENPKNATFYVYLKRHFKKKNVKNVIHNSKFQTLLTFHYMESPLQLKNNVCL